MRNRAALDSTWAVTWALLSGLASASGASAAAGSGASNEGVSVLEEITVTATRREERLEKVPISIDALSQSALTEGGLKTISDIATVSPGFQYAEPQNIPSTIQTLAIRGLNSSTGQSPVGVYYGHVVGDDVRVTPALLFQDLHRGDGGRYFDIFSGVSSGSAAAGQFVNGRLIRAQDGGVLTQLSVLGSTILGEA